MISRRAASLGLATTLIGLTGRAGAQTPPPDLPADGLKGNGLRWNVTARPEAKPLLPGAARGTDVWTFNGELGPAFRMKHGTEARLSLRNDTPLPLSLHFHGVRGPNAMDGVAGVTQEPVGPGGSFDYSFTPPDAGTFLIRPCIPGGSAEPLERGLSALLIVEEADPPGVDHDIALLVDDWALGGDGKLALGDPAPAGRLGNFLSINGKSAPQRITAAPGGRIRLRLANACGARIMRLGFEGLEATVIAVDGQPSSAFPPRGGVLPMAPGSRYDLLVDLPPDGGATGIVKALIGQGMPLVEIVTAGEKRPPRPAISPFPANPRLPEAIRLQDATRKDVVIEGDPAQGRWTVNGAAGKPDGAPLVGVERGTPVVLALTNRTPLAQPVHLHGHACRLLHALDDGWEPYWMDTVQVPANRTLRIAFVADNPGKWLIASTVMERFDAGLWGWMEVT